MDQVEHMEFPQVDTQVVLALLMVLTGNFGLLVLMTNLGARLLIIVSCILFLLVADSSGNRR